jgi:hypothetical protein
MKRYNWGWRIVTAFVIFATGTLSWVTYAMTHEVELVRSDYYEHSLKQDEVAAAQARGLASGTEVNYDASNHSIRVSFPSHDNVVGTLTFYRPNSQASDKSFPITLDELGTMQLPTGNFAVGLWHVTLDWKQHGLSHEIIKTYTF